IRSRSCISLEGRTCWCGRRGSRLRRKMAHRKTDVVKLHFHTDFRVLHPLLVLGRRRTLFAGSMATLLFAIEGIVNFAEGIHGLEFQERWQEKPRMNLVDHPRSLDVVDDLPGSFGASLASVPGIPAHGFPRRN